MRRDGLSFDARLRILVDQAFDLRGTPYLREACAAIVELHDRRHLIEHERREVTVAELLELLRETAPPERKEWSGQEPPPRTATGRAA